MIEAYKKYWKNYADFTGRSSRSDYWWAMLIYFMIMAVWFAIFIAFALIGSQSADYNGEPSGAMLAIGIILFILIGIWNLVNFIPLLSCEVRRLRDAGQHWAWIFIGLVPYIGSFILLILLCLPTKQDMPNGAYPQYPNQGAPVPGQQGFVNPAQPQQPVQPVMPQAQPAAVNTPQGVSQAVSETASQAPVTSETPQA